MNKGRVEAFSDGVLAIVITIMVLKLTPPQASNLQGLLEIAPTFTIYLLSFAYVGVYWVNHHNLLATIDTVTNKLIIKNLHWLFWMTLIPFAMEWVGVHPLEKIPATLYSLILLISSINYQVLQKEVLRAQLKKQENNPHVDAHNIRGAISIGTSVLAVVLALLVPIVSYVLFFFISLMWLLPGAKVESFYEKFFQRVA